MLQMKKRQWNNVPRNQTRPTRSEIPKLLSGLNTIRETADTFLLAVCDFVEIALFTGLRKSELLNLKWEQVNLEERTFRILETKNGDALELPMADHLHSIFERRKEITSNEYVFQAENDHGYVREPKKAIQKIIDTTETSFTLHDLRRTFTRTAELLRVGTYTIKRLLNHKTGRNDVTAGYTILTAEELRPFSKEIEGRLLAYVS